MIGVVAEGATPLPGSMPLRDGGVDEYGHRRFTGVAQQLGEELERRTGKEVRTTVLGHVQRGGTPTSFDRVLATRFGLHATVAAHEGATVRWWPSGARRSSWCRWPRPWRGSRR